MSESSVGAGSEHRAGPLQGLRVVELAGKGPAPFGAMMLADLGADVVRIDRPSGLATSTDSTVAWDLLRRGRREVIFDLKSPDGLAVARRLVQGADVFIEGFRPGVAERLGLGPDSCLAENHKLVYARMSGWGQVGPYADQPGHDINYIALAGALDPIGPAQGPPVPPLNLVGDFGGGGMLLAFGIMAGVYEAARSGEGQVIDAAMVDGAAVLTTMFHGFLRRGDWQDERGTNLLDGGAPFYAVYRTADEKYISVGAIEPKFYSALLAACGIDEATVPEQLDRASWPEVRRRLQEVFVTRRREEWSERLETAGVCFAPVLGLAEAPTHPHLQARDTFVEVDGVVQPAPAPRFSRTAPRVEHGPRRRGADTIAVLAEHGFSAHEIDELMKTGAIIRDDH